MGKAALEPQILEEINEYMQHFIEPNLNRPINMHQSLPRASANIISQLLFGRRFGYDDAEFNQMLTTLDQTVQLFAKVSLFENIPFGSLVFSSQVKSLGQMLRNTVLPTLESYIQECKQNQDVNQPRTMVEKYFNSIEIDGENSGNI